MFESFKTFDSVANNTPLTDAPGETGGQFARHASSEDSDPPRIISGAVVPQQNSPSNGQVYFDLTNLSSNSYTVEWSGTLGDAISDFLEVFARLGTAASSGYGFFWLRNDNRLELRKGASSLSLLNGAGSGLANTQVRFFLQVAGSNPTVLTAWIRSKPDGLYWNPSTPGWQAEAVNCFSVTDSTSPITQTGKGAWGQRLQTSAPTTMTAWSIDVVETPPTLSAPTATVTGQTTATVGATTDKTTGTMYAVITTSATQPSIAQIIAGQDHTGVAAIFAGNQAISAAGAKTFNGTGMTANTGYYAHMVHRDGSSNDSNRISTSQFTTLPLVPTDPTIGATTSITSNSATINWTDNSSNENSFTVQIETPSGAGNWTNASTGASNPTAANATSLVITGLSGSTQYRARVKGTNTGGDSGWSTGTAFTTSAPTDTTPPTLTGSITIGTVTNTSIQMSWPAGSDNVGVVGYDVSSNGGSSWTSLGNVLTYTFTGLTPGASYPLRVRARDAENNVSTPALSASQATPGYSFTTSPMFNNTTQLQINSTSVDFSFFPAGVIGGLEGITPLEGTGTTHAANGTLTVSNLPVSGAGMVLVTDLATGAVFFENVTAA